MIVQRSLLFAVLACGAATVASAQTLPQTAPLPAPTPEAQDIAYPGTIQLSVDATDLESATADYDRQVSLAVQSDPDVQAFVERLEQAAAEELSDEPGPLPSGDTIARELQRFPEPNEPEDWAFALSPDGRTLARTTKDHAIECWELASWKRRRRFLA